ncbi:hypothetical protein HDV05_004743 [Chytridiales sp. JEL 0842]|nr:hypothetical protein HDV05_004743 [Chytridiales sp. JEL 0842]
MKTSTNLIGLVLTALALLPWSTFAAPVFGTAGLGLKLRGRKFTTSPVTASLYATGDFVHIKAGCADETSMLQPSVNFTLEYWAYFDPTELFDNAAAPHFFSMTQEFNFHVAYMARAPDGTIYWFWNWLTPCGWTEAETIYGNFMPLKQWVHFAITNENGRVTTYLNGVRKSGTFCNAPFTTPPVWTIGSRDWSTETALKNQLTPFYPTHTFFNEFRIWNKGSTLDEIKSRMYRSLTTAEMSDRNLFIYFDLSNPQEGYILNNLATNYRRLQGFLGGSLGIEESRPQIEPSTAPVVSSFATARTVRVTMKESGDYLSTVPIPISVIDDVTGAPITGAGITYNVSVFPNSGVVTLSTEPYGVKPLNLAASAIGSTFSLYATHIRNDNMPVWAPQNFNVTARFNGTVVNIPVTITIKKNAAPVIGDTGGAIVPPDVPTDVKYNPLTTKNKFFWRNSTYNPKLTWEFWFVTTMDNRYMAVDSIQGTDPGRINAEVNKNLNFDYGWNLMAGSGRTAYPIRQKFGIWAHAAMVSGGIGGRMSLYLNGELVAEVPGSAPVRGLYSDPPSDPQGYINGSFYGNLVVDEFRMWSTNRTIQEIRRDMFKTLTGKEKDLFMYHNFDSYSVESDGSYLFRDLSGNNNDLICRGYARTVDCPLVKSHVPIGGRVDDITFKDGAKTALWDPAGFDPDDDSQYIRFVIDELPKNARLMADTNVTYRALDGDMRNGVSNAEYVANVTVGTYIKKLLFVPSVQVVPSEMGGGNPFDQFTYHVTDGLRDSPKATVTIYRKCPPGTYLDQPNRKCIACAPGFYSTDFSYNDKCLPCPAGTSQPNAGSSSCVPCEQATFISLVKAATPVAGQNATNVTAYPDFLPSLAVGVDDIASFGTFQDQPAQATCKSCQNLQYAIQKRAIACDGQAFIPKYISLSGIEDLFSSPAANLIPVAPANGTKSLLTANNRSKDLTNVLNSTTVSEDVKSAVQSAGVVSPPKIVLAVSLVIAIVTFVGLIGIYVYSADPVIKASSPICLTFTAVGIILGALSTITYSVKPSNASCIAEIWVFPIAWSIVLGTLISKTFRILRIFNNPRALKIRMTNLDLFGYMIAAVSINVIILIVWTIIDPPTPITVQRGNSAGLIYIYCSSKSSTVQGAFTAVLYLYNVALLAILSLLAFFTRNVNALFSESKYIGYFVAATLASCIFVPLTYMPSNEIMTVYAFKSIAVLVISTSAAVTLIGVKFHTIFKNRQAEAVGVKNTQSTMVASTTSFVAGSGKRIPYGAAIINMFKDKPNTISAPVVFSSKKMGVVFWKAKVAVLNMDHRMLYLISVDPLTEKEEKAKDNVVQIPEMIMFPLSKITVTIPQASSHGQSINTSAGTTSNTSSIGEESSASGAGGAGGQTTLMTIKNNDTGHAITIQFETMQSRKEFEKELKKVGDVVAGGADAKKGGASTNGVKSSIKSTSAL